MNLPPNLPNYVTKTRINNFIKAALKEDVHVGDHTGLACIPARKKDKAKLLVKADGVLAGLELAKIIFTHIDPKVKIKTFMNDGDKIKYGDIAFHVTSNSRSLLVAERLVLNCMQRMSGIATLSNQFATEVEDLPVQILDTRKTTPTIRFLEKWAVLIGGCTNYRFGLYDWIMIKDNHVDAAGSITNAIKRVDKYQKANKLNLNVTVEVRNLKELKEVLKVGKVTRIMLDNFEIPTLKKAVGIIGDQFETEASGGITMKTVRKVAKTGVQFISSGALTHSYHSLDLSLKVMK